MPSTILSDRLDWLLESGLACMLGPALDVSSRPNKSWVSNLFRDLSEILNSDIPY